MSKLKLSILDLAKFTEETKTASEVLNQSTEIAKLADKLGYTRYWFAEHHNTSMIMSMFPEIMVAHVATQTQRIRVGTGGVMLPNDSAFSVAERFAMLEALYPGRIDLGIGRAPGTDGRTALALRKSWEAIKQDTFPEQLTELLGFLGHNLPDKHPFAHINASPDPFLIPEIYMLGSSTGGVEFALTKGLPFVFAAQINADLAVPVLTMYRRQFKPSEYLQEPKSILSIMVFTAETDEEAYYQAAPAILHWTMLTVGKRIVNPTFEEALSYRYSLQEEAVKQSIMRKFVIGSPGKVSEMLWQWAKETLVDEIIIFDLYSQMKGRRQGYELLAKELGLS